MPSCPLCQIIEDESDRIVGTNEHAIAIRDAYPLTEGHTLIIPKRHVGSFFALTRQEVDGLWQLMQRDKVQLDSEFAPIDYNIGINDGPAAGQTVLHLHIHLIPRYTNYRADPRGGVRWIIPEKADYWSQR